MEGRGETISGRYGEKFQRNREMHGTGEGEKKMARETREFD